MRARLAGCEQQLAELNRTIDGILEDKVGHL